MQGGDIAAGWESNRVVLVWEGTCGTQPQGAAALRERMLRMRGRWEEVVKMWGFIEAPLQRAFALAYKNIPVDTITFIDPEFAEALEAMLERIGARIHRVEWYENPEDYARVLNVSRDVTYVVDSDPKRLAIFGHRALPVVHGEDFGQWI
jgi:hypothetical protein